MNATKVIYISSALFASTLAVTDSASASFAEKTENEEGFDIRAGSGSASDLSQEQSQDNTTEQNNVGSVQQTGIYNLSGSSRMSIGDVDCASPNLLISANTVGNQTVLSGALTIPLGSNVGRCGDALEARSQLAQVNLEETSIAICDNLNANGIDVTDSEQFPVLAEKCSDLTFTSTPAPTAPAPEVQVQQTTTQAQVQQQVQEAPQVNVQQTTPTPVASSMPVTGSNNIIPSGFTNKQDLLIKYDSSVAVRTVFARFGITRTDIVNGRMTMLGSNERDGNLMSVGHVAYGHNSEVEVRIHETRSVYMRSLQSWDVNGRSSGYGVLEGTTSDGKYFAIIADCGNPVVDAREFESDEVVQSNRRSVQDMIQASRQRQQNLTEEGFGEL